MKKRKNVISAIGMLILLLIIVGCSNYAQTSTTDSTPVKTENLRIAKIALPGLFCQGCVVGATAILENIEGIVEVNVTLKSKIGIVVYDSVKTNAEEIVKKVQFYDAKVLSDQKYNP